MNYQNVEFWQVLIVSASRYFVFAGISYLIFYYWKRNAWISHKIQNQFPSIKTIDNELKYSLLTLFIFAIVIYILLFTSVRGYTKIYNHIGDYPIIYFFVSLPLIIFIHDTYFYFTHRLMHWRKIFPFVHHIHHKSHNPTPLAAFSFHPLEALIEIGVLPLIVFTLPVHRGILGLFGLYMIVMNVIGHLGFELFPKWFLRNKFSRWFNTSTHHNMHHHYSKNNFGLYFNFWDRLLGTNHPDYERNFNELTSRRDKQHQTTSSSIVH